MTISGQRSDADGGAAETHGGAGINPAGQRGLDRVPTDTPQTQMGTQVTTQRIVHDRIADIVTFGASYKQFTKRQLKDTVFANDRSVTQCQRWIQKAVSAGVLDRIEIQRPIGGTQGGSNQFVYQLGAAGLKMARELRRPVTAIDPHELAITEVYRTLYQAQGETFKLLRVDTEPACHEIIANIEINPDTYIELDLGDRIRRARIEVDMGSERSPYFKKRLERYRLALLGASDEQRKRWPFTVWVIPPIKRQQERRTSIQSWIDEEPAAARQMHRVCVLQELVQTLRQ